MRIFDLISMTIKNLLRRKMRTVLTITGVIVGTCSIVVMVSLGIGQTQAMEESIAQMGDLTTIEVYAYGGRNPSDTEQPKLNDEMMHKILSIPGVKAGTPYWNPPHMDMRAVSGKKDRYELGMWNVRGVYADQLEKMDFKLAEGELLPAGKEHTSSKKKKKIRMLMGSKIIYEFTDTKRQGQAAYRWEGMTDAAGNPLPPFVDPMKDDLFLVLQSNEMTEDHKPKYEDLRYEIEVTGLMGSSDPNVWDENGYNIYMDIYDLRDLYENYKKAFKIKEEKGSNVRDPNVYNNAKIKVDSIDNVEAVDKAIKELGFETQSLNSIREPMMKQMRQQQIFLGGIGAISLLVAAIGISNTMVMSIYERTREIGVMKVLGCRLSNIRSIFLMEAGLIGFFGGLCGIGISYALSYGINYVVSSGMLNQDGGMGGMMMGGMGMSAKLSVIPPWLALCGIGFATVIGLVSGFSPANRAVKISALEAIKHE